MLCHPSSGRAPPLPPVPPAPAAPFTLTAVSATQVNASWTSVANANGYVIEDMGSTGAWQVLSYTSSTSYAATGLTPNTPYQFRVGYWSSSPDLVAWETPQSVTTFPAAPSFTLTTIGYTQINVAWTNMNANSYTIDWWANGLFQPAISVSGTATSYPLANLSPNVNYQIEVGAVGVNSAEVSWASPQSVTISPAPVFVLTAISPTQVVFAWSAVPGATGYEITTPALGNPYFVLDSFGPGVTSYAWPDPLSPGTTYTFGVVSLGPWGSAFASNQSVTMPSAAPTFSARAVSSGEVDSSWYTVLTASNYQVEEQIDNSTSPNPSNWQLVNSQPLPGSATSYPDTNLTPNTTYWFRVGSVGSWGTAWATPQGVLTFPAAPTLNVTAGSQTSVNLSWNNVGASGYTAIVEGHDYFNSTLLPSGTTGQSFYNLSPGTTYSCEVGASNASGTSWSNFPSVVTYPAAPTFTLAGISPYSVQVSWSPVGTATGYEVDMLIDLNGTLMYWQPLQNTTYTTLSFTDNNLSFNTSYTFRVDAINASGTTPAPGQNITTPDTSPNWSGYVIVPGAVTPPNQVTEVGGSWVQPAISSPYANAAASIWVGIDGQTWNGVASNTVEQIGTAWDATTKSYTPWIEFFGDGVWNAQTQQWTSQGTYFNQFSINALSSTQFNVQPGDTISAGLEYVGNFLSPVTFQLTSSFLFWFQDKPVGGQTVSWSEGLYTSYVVPVRTSAEWIVEAPAPGSPANAPPYALGNFGTVNFTGAWAEAGATSGPITAFSKVEFDVTLGGSGSGGGTDYTSGVVNVPTAGLYEPVANSSSFSVTFGSSTSSTDAAPSSSSNAAAQALQAGRGPAPVFSLAPLQSPTALSNDTVRFFNNAAATTAPAANGTPSSAAAATVLAPEIKSLQAPLGDAYWADPDNTEWLDLFAFEAEPSSLARRVGVADYAG